MPARRRSSAPLALTTLALVLAACEPRVEEPIPPPSAGEGVKPAATASAAAAATASESASASAAASAAAPAPSGSASAAKARCIHATPKEPVRKVNITGKFDPGCPADPSKNPKLREGRLSFVEAGSAADAGKPAAPVVKVEIADKNDDRMRGLMYRKAMDEDRGMIFVFDEKEDHTFWMKNTCIPLDMLFVDDDGTIVGIEENTTTLSEQTFSVGCESKYVVEVNAGWSRRHGVVAGQKIKMEL